MSSVVESTVTDDVLPDVTPFDNRTIPAYTYYDPAVHETGVAAPVPARLVPGGPVYSV